MDPGESGDRLTQVLEKRILHGQFHVCPRGAERLNSVDERPGVGGQFGHRIGERVGSGTAALHRLGDPVHRLGERLLSLGDALQGVLHPLLRLSLSLSRILHGALGLDDSVGPLDALTVGLVRFLGEVPVLLAHGVEVELRFLQREVGLLPVEGSGVRRHVRQTLTGALDTDDCALLVEGSPSEGVLQVLQVLAGVLDRLAQVVAGTLVGLSRTLCVTLCLSDALHRPLHALLGGGHTLLGGGDLLGRVGSGGTGLTHRAERGPDS